MNAPVIDPLLILTGLAAQFADGNQPLAQSVAACHQSVLAQVVELRQRLEAQDKCLDDAMKELQAAKNLAAARAIRIDELIRLGTPAHAPGGYVGTAAEDRLSHG